MSLAPTLVRPSVHLWEGNSFGFPFWDLTNRWDEIAVANMEVDMVAEKVTNMVADMLADKK